MIHLTEAAANEIRRLQSSRKKPDSQFLLGVQKGGCSGLFYTLQLYEPGNVETSENASVKLKLQENNGISIVVDEESYPYLDGLKLDYAEDLMGGGFRFQNPNAHATCSCGQSFSVES